jgi:hypothetical protein
MTRAATAITSGGARRHPRVVRLVFTAEVSPPGRGMAGCRRRCLIRQASHVRVAAISKEVTHMLRWNVRYVRALVALGAFAALLVDAGAGLRWS